MRRYFLGLAANYSTRELWRHTLTVGTEADRRKLSAWLAKKYGGEAILTKNGRSGLALALEAYLRPGEGVLVNGFTCFAVYEAVRAAGLTPVWVDIDKKDLNFTVKTLEAAWKRATGVKAEKSGGDRSKALKITGIIVQNTLGNPVEMAKIEQFAKKHRLTLIEDLAHCTGVRYPDGREAGTVGAAAVLSFGKDKVIDTTSGGAVVLKQAPSKLRRTPDKAAGVQGSREGRDLTQRPTGARDLVQEPTEAPRCSDTLRARFYPLLGLAVRGLSYVHLSGVMMRFLLKIHWVERSADNRLDVKRKIAAFEAKLALGQLERLAATGVEQGPLREFALVKDRAAVLKKLQEQGYYFGGLWYEKPVSPERYYREVKFPEKECPVATEVAREIVNLPNYYSTAELAQARKIIEEDRA